VSGDRIIQSSVEPPAGSVAEPASEVNALVQVNPAALVRTGTEGCRLAWASVGRALGEPRAQLAAVLADLRRQVDERGLVALGEAGALGTDDAAALSHPMTSLAKALRAGVLSLGDASGGCRRLLLVINSPLSEPANELMDAAAALDAAGIGVDVIANHPGADLGLLSRLSALRGGVVLLPDAAGERSVGGLLGRRVRELGGPTAEDVFVRFDFSPIFQAHRIYRVAPYPLLLRGLRGGEEDRSVRIELGHVALDQPPPQLLLVGLMPPRRLGRYRVARVVLGERGQMETATTDVMHACTADPHEASRVNAQVRVARERADLAGWAEEVARAYTEGDARRVAAILDRMVRQLITLERGSAVEQTAAMRVRFLRTGALGRVDLNRLRRMAMV
jgi:hypothetical protein